MPEFGRAALPLWWLDPAHTYLNHGTVGATPRAVLDVQHVLQREIEAHPARFLIRELADLRAADIRAADPPAGHPSARPVPRLRAAADRVAAFLGVHGDDLVFVDNASAGINAVLRSLARDPSPAAPTSSGSADSRDDGPGALHHRGLRPGDEIVLHDLCYGAVALAARHVAEPHGARVVPFASPFPLAPDADPVEAWWRPLAAALTPRTRLVLLDHVVSDTGQVVPVAALAARLRARGVPVAVDGAHAPVAVPLDIAALGVDFYVANLHKWAFAPRSTGVLWADPRWQRRLHPNTISWGLGEGFATEFDWTGTRDPSAWLAAPAGLDFARDTLGLDALRAWNHDRVVAGARHLVARWDVRDDDGAPWPLPPDETIGCLLTMPLPDAVVTRFGAGREGVLALKARLLDHHRIEAHLLWLRGRPWVRLAAQVYNESADYERLGEAVLAEVAA